MDVDRLLFEAGLDAQLHGVRLHVGESDLSRLLHHVAQLPGQGQALAAVHDRGLHEQHLAAGPGDRQPRGHTRNRRPLRDLGVELGASQVLPHLRRLDPHRRRQLPALDPGRDLAQQASQLPLQTELVLALRLGVCGHGDSELRLCAARTSQPRRNHTWPLSHWE